MLVAAWRRRRLVIRVAGLLCVIDFGVDLRSIGRKRRQTKIPSVFPPNKNRTQLEYGRRKVIQTSVNLKTIVDVTLVENRSLVPVCGDF